MESTEGQPVRFTGRVLRLMAAAIWLSHPLAAAAEGELLDCLIEPRESVVVSAPVIGVVGEVVVDRGDIVSAEQVLATLESSVERSTVRVARERAESRAELESSEARLAFEKRRLIRAKLLHAESVMSEEELDEIESSVIVAETARLQAKENTRLAELELVRAQAILGVRTIRSPVDGVVVKVMLHAGEYADPPQVLEVAQIDPLRVEVFAPLDQLGKISVGDIGRVVLEEPVARVYEAKVVVVDRVVDAASGTIGIRLELPNPELEVLAGLSCRVDFAANAETAGID